ncbi:carbohydrate ABC transporter membrane protein 2 (CUT1 family) [Streptomyces sp. SLBN-118]|uniref:carbohydrate ABC transporter permease n=1 Tax=Streptomyces sp. SLBN-118 TaxID=2768454 RepID=UPI0011529872|nr:carbohydrate ABC transporter permease [Streptomyces sp. SLBN-118]TQK51252.1 carbohydrate ABC transporter membrane protein 2 (CUT1 family) [Streptomyces sp. SLBN-118]
MAAVTELPVSAAAETRAQRTGRRFWRVPQTPGQWAVLAALIVLSLMFLVPVYLMVAAGLKSPAQADVSRMWQLPSPLSLDGYREAWSRLSGNFLNSLLMVVPATVLSSLVGALNGFVLSKVRFRRANLVFTLMLLGMFIPYQAILIPMVTFLQWIGLYGTIGGLVLVHVIYGIPIATLIFRNYYAAVPQAIVEAAAIDGAGVLQTFWRVMLPLSAPGFVVAGIFQFTNIWNDFLFGIVVVPDSSNQPVTVALNNLSGTQSVNWNVVMAGAVIAAIPTALIYLALGKYFIRGLTAGSVK